MKNGSFFIVAAFLLLTTNAAEFRNENGNNNKNSSDVIDSKNLFFKTNYAKPLPDAVYADRFYSSDTTPDIVQLVKDAVELVREKGEAAFEDFRVPGSRWQKGETYIFVLDPEGEMLVHADAAMEGRNQLGLKDINGKPIVRGLIQAVTISPQKQNGWYHYQWPVPGGLLPRWKSSYVQLVKAPSGKTYVVGSGMYNDRMEKEFVVDMVKDAVGQIEKK